MNMSATAQTGRARTEQAAKGTGVKVAAKAGLTARGVIYVLVGILAVQIAFGDSEHQADRGGALAAIADKPFGKVMLWAVGIGLACMALWRLSEVVFGSAGPDGGKAQKRALAAVRFVFYSFVAYSALSFAAGSGGAGSSDKKSRDVTARVMGVTGGRWLVGAAGVAIVAAGLWIAYRAITRHYHKKLRLEEMSHRVRQLVDVTGVSGGSARGIVFAGAGVFAVRAAIEFEPDKAKGLDDTLRAFAGTSAGPWLLVVVAVGLALFGVFSFALARWRKV